MAASKCAMAVVERAAPVAGEPHRSFDRAHPRDVAACRRDRHRALPELERSVVVAEPLSDARQLEDHLVHVGAAPARVRAAREFERRGQIVGGLSVGVLRRCVASGRAQVLHRLVGQTPRVGSRVVKRQAPRVRHRGAAVQRLEGFGDRPVQRARARQPDLRVQRLLKKRM